MRNGMTALLLCAAVAVAWSHVGVIAAPPTTRSYTAGNYMLELDGIQAGFVFSVEGGQAVGDVVKVPGEDFFFKKQLGNYGVRDIRLEIGSGMDKSVYNAITLALQGQIVRLNGALLRSDFNGNIVSRLDFLHAQITEVTLPAADGASKDNLRLSIVLSPEQTSLNRKASGKVGAISVKQKPAIVSSFRLMIDGLDMTKVSKVEAMTVKLPRAARGIGDGNEFCLSCEDYTPINPVRVDFPHVVITLTDASAGSVYDWLNDFVIAGNNDDSREKSGTLEFLTATTQATVFSIKFKNLGIFDVMPVIDMNEHVARVMAAMYCESMEFLTH